MFETVWLECLGDLARYLFGIEENEAKDKDHWKEVARRWYLRTIDAGHGMEGRLFHHLGILSKDPLTQLFYYAKRYRPWQEEGNGSLTVVHGFTSGRESFLILIDPVIGTKWKDWNNAFVKLHGMLFARLQLDSFDDELDESYNLWHQGEFLTDVEWARIAATNVAALYQYNRKDSLLKEALRQGRREKREAEHEESATLEEPTDPETILPPSQTTENLQIDMTNVDRAPEHFANIPADIRSGDKDDVSLSKIVFEKSCQLTFGLFSEILNSDVYPTEPRIYVHVMLVFLAYALRYQPVVRLLERKIPWQELADYLSDVYEFYLKEVGERVADELPSLACDLPLEELTGPVLLDDMVMRGFEWSRKLFPKGWFQKIDPVYEDLECMDDGWKSGLKPFSHPDALISYSVKEETARKQRILTLGIQISKVFSTMYRCLF